MFVVAAMLAFGAQSQGWINLMGKGFSVSAAMSEEQLADMYHNGSNVIPYTGSISLDGPNRRLVIKDFHVILSGLPFFNNSWPDSLVVEIEGNCSVQMSTLTNIVQSSSNLRFKCAEGASLTFEYGGSLSETFGIVAMVENSSLIFDNGTYIMKNAQSPVISFQGDYEPGTHPTANPADFTLDKIAPKSVVFKNCTAKLGGKNSVITGLKGYLGFLNCEMTDPESYSFDSNGILMSADGSTKLKSITIEPTIPDFEVNGIWYHVKNGDAYVTGHPDTHVNSSKAGYATNGYKGNIVIPSSVTHNGETYTVRGIMELDIPVFTCSEINSVAIPKTMLKLPRNVFSTSTVKKVTFEEDGTDWLYLDYGVFAQCYSLNSIELPARLKGIGEYAFYGCNGLKTLTIPSRCDTVGSNFVDGCSHLEKLIMRQSRPPFVSGFGGLGTPQIAGSSVVDHLKIFTSAAAFAYYRTDDYWKTLYPDKIYNYALVSKGATIGTMSFGANGNFYLNKTIGFKAFRTVSFKPLNSATGKLVVEPAKYAYNSDTFMGDGVIIKVNKTTTPYLLEERFDKAEFAETHDTYLRSHYGGTIYQDGDGVVRYRLDNIDGRWVRIPSSGATVARAECYLEIPGNMDSTPSVIEMELADGTDPFAIIQGDVNGDGKVNVSDVAALVNMILGITPMDDVAADVNGDSKVNVSDISALINLILGIH